MATGPSTDRTSRKAAMLEFLGKLDQERDRLKRHAFKGRWPAGRSSLAHSGRPQCGQACGGGAQGCQRLRREGRRLSGAAAIQDIKATPAPASPAISVHLLLAFTTLEAEDLDCAPVDLEVKTDPSQNSVWPTPTSVMVVLSTRVMTSEPRTTVSETMGLPA